MECNIYDRLIDARQSLNFYLSLRNFRELFDPRQYHQLAKVQMVSRYEFTTTLQEKPTLRWISLHYFFEVGRRFLTQQHISFFVTLCKDVFCRPQKKKKVASIHWALSLTKIKVKGINSFQGASCNEG